LDKENQEEASRPLLVSKAPKGQKNQRSIDRLEASAKEETAPTAITDPPGPIPSILTKSD